MSFDVDNSENIINDSKSNEAPKSPGRLAAEERAERIRYAEEYRRKLEEEKGPVQPKKTKAAEQKEQARLEKIAQEQAAVRAQLEEQRLESERRISAAREKLEALGESIQKAEAEVKAYEAVTVEQPIAASAPNDYTKTVSTAPYKPVKLASNIVMNIPVQSFSIPCVVTRRNAEEQEDTTQTGANASAPQQQTAYVQYGQPMFYPVITPPVFVPVPNNSQQPAASEPQVVVVEKPAAPAKRNPVLPIASEPIVRKRPKPTVVAKPRLSVRTVNLNEEADEDPVYRPAITYGVAVTEGGWEHEIEDDDDIIIESSASAQADESMS